MQRRNADGTPNDDFLASLVDRAGRQFNAGQITAAQYTALVMHIGQALSATITHESHVKLADYYATLAEQILKDDDAPAAPTPPTPATPPTGRTLN